MTKNVIGGIVALGILGFLVYLGGVVKKENPPVAAEKEVTQTSRETAMICTTDMATEFHIHPMLKIVIDGIEQTIPADIGITEDCMHPLHTHDATGKIHVESPVQKDFTLGDFFAVWGKDFSSTKILDSIADGNAMITVTVNGTSVDTFENTILHDNDQIVISYDKKLPM